jgi:hypothetical protein
MVFVSFFLMPALSAVRAIAAASVRGVWLIALGFSDEGAERLRRVWACGRPEKALGFSPAPGRPGPDATKERGQARCGWELEFDAQWKERSD